LYPPRQQSPLHFDRGLVIDEKILKP
jgi:hypothetical protein